MEKDAGQGQFHKPFTEEQTKTRAEEISDLLDLLRGNESAPDDRR